MANNQIRIDNLGVYSSKIASLAADTSTIVKQSKSSLDSMKNSWNGKSYKAFQQNYDTLVNHLNQLEKSMLEVANAIQTISNNYQMADEEKTVQS